jgi:regulator of sigma E protease
LASLRRGDRVLSINGAVPTTWDDIQERLLTVTPPIRIAVERGAPLVLDVPMDAAAREALVKAIDPYVPPVLQEVRPGSPAAGAGLRPGDRVIAVNGDSISSWLQFSRIIRAHADLPLRLQLVRDGAPVVAEVTPEKQRVFDPHTGKDFEGGLIGVAQPVQHRAFGVTEALAEGVQRTVRVSGQVVEALKGLITGKLSLKELGGPIRIGQVSGEAARQGPGQLVYLMALLSVNLAILNLLPIPVLDGGGLMLLAAEAIRRRPLSRELRVRLVNAGLIVVAAVMLFAITNDVLGLFRR